MNPTIQHLLTIVILASSQLLDTSCFAAGGIGSGGGDSAEAEFVSIGQGIAQSLRGDLGPSFPEINQSAFTQAVNSTQVIMTSLHLQLNGDDRDAINYPVDTKIEVNRPTWIKLTPANKVRLAFHEYLGIVGVEHDAYTVSSRLQSVLGDAKILSLAAAAAPDAEYHCQLIRLNPMDARIQEHCDGGAYFDLTTRNIWGIDPNQNPFEPANYYYNQACGDIAVNLTKGISLDGKENFSVQLSQLQGGKGDWTKREPDEYAGFEASIYSPPEEFALTLTIHNKMSLFSRSKTISYIVSCQAQD